MARVIGIDFGNWMAYVCTVNGMDETSRMGGKVEDLIPATYHNTGSDGIPNEYFWNMTTKGGKTNTNELMGFMAARDTNRPAENHLRLLKKHMGESITLYGDASKKTQETFRYDEIITKMFAYHVQMANDTLRENYGEKGTTNLISVTFPADLCDPARLTYFLNLAEQADSGAKDDKGNMLKIKVVGAVCEPAAAGLDRLNEQRAHIKTDTVTYGTFDLGGGTFDLSIVSLFPNGKKYPSGKTYYYDLICEGSGLSIAGSDFSNRLKELMEAKAEEETDEPLTAGQIRAIGNSVERCKKELSAAMETVFSIETADGDIIDIPVTRAEFETAISKEVDKIMKFTKAFFMDHKAHMPDEIIMTGGSSYIPCIQERLQALLPQYKGKIHLHRPSKAAAYGAARFYAMEGHHTSGFAKESASASNIPTGPVRKVVKFDLGTKVTAQNAAGMKMSTLISAGTEIPCNSGDLYFRTGANSTRYTDYSIFSANKANPNPDNVDTDYKLLVAASLDYGTRVPPKTRTGCRLTIDSLGAARLEAWQDGNQSIHIDKKFNIEN